MVEANFSQYGIEMMRNICGSSSVDRALAFQAGGRGFEPRLPLYKSELPIIASLAQLARARDL